MTDILSNRVKAKLENDNKDFTRLEIEKAINILETAQKKLKKEERRQALTNLSESYDLKEDDALINDFINNLAKLNADSRKEIMRIIKLNNTSSSSKKPEKIINSKSQDNSQQPLK